MASNTILTEAYVGKSATTIDTLIYLDLCSSDKEAKSSTKRTQGESWALDEQ